MSSRFTRRAFLIFLALALAGSAIFYWRPFADPTRTGPELQRLAGHCSEQLSKIAEEDAFDGAEVAGSPEHVLAAFSKWTSLDPMDWVGRRPDLRMVIAYGDDFEICHRFDGRGFVIATHSRHKTLETARWVRRHSEAGRPTITQFERDPSVHNGEATAIFTLGIDAVSGKVLRLQLAGQRAGERSVEGTYRFDATTGELEILIGLEERAVMTPDGVLSSTHYRTCFEPDQPCDEPWETTRYTFDDDGNPTDRRTDLGGEEQHDQLVLTKNDRGDWTERRLAGASDENETARRTLIYRN